MITHGHASVVCVPALSVAAALRVNVPWTGGADAVDVRDDFPHGCLPHGGRRRGMRE